MDDLEQRVAEALAPAYELERELGRGGMAIVYRARDTRLKRPVAVKLLPPELAFRADIRSRFLREAETAARLSHPNIVPIYSVDERAGLVYFAMALVEGGSVGDRVRRDGRLPVADARRILREVADALAYAHAHGVIHRDIKPDNILLDAGSGRAMVTDFGIARAASDDEGGTRLTATGTAIGTPAYMSPEQCAGDRDIDGRSDLYALGTVAYQMLTGEPPFTGGNTPAIMIKHVSEAPVPLRQRRPDVPEDLERIVMRLLAKDPAGRFADGAALVAALDGAPFTPVPPPAAPPAAPPDGPSRAERAAPRVIAIGPGGDRALAALSSAGIALEQAQGVIERAHELRTFTRQQRRELREQARRIKRGHDLPMPERIRRVRRRFASWIGTGAFLFGINYFTGDGFWWCVFPIMAIALGVFGEIGRLWADGVPLRAILGGPLPPELAAPAAPNAPSGVPGGAALAGAPPLPSAGTVEPAGADEYAPVLRQAMTDRESINELLGRMSDAERRMIPEVQPTADALMTRIVSLNAALRRLDPSMSADRLSALDQRIAQLEPVDPSGDPAARDRLLGILRRQREKLAELVSARARLRDQYEAAGLLLQNLSLDLLKVRASGLDSALSGLASVTQEARALSREIGYVLSAADELKGMEASTGT